MSNILDLPPDALLEIFKYLEYDEVTKICSTNTLFFTVFANAMWLLLLRMKYPDISWNNTKLEDAKEAHKSMFGLEKIIKNSEYVFDRKRKLNRIFINCAYSGYFDIMKYMMSLDHIYEIDPSCGHNLPFRYACQHGYLDIAKYLMSLDKKYGVKYDDYDHRASYDACHNEHVDVVKYLVSLDEKYEICLCLCQPIPCLCRDGHLDMIKYIMSLGKGADPAANENWGVLWASLGGHLEIVKYLISLDSSYGVDPAAHNNYAVRSASERGTWMLLNT